jgi:hypothetical protein
VNQSRCLFCINCCLRLHDKCDMDSHQTERRQQKRQQDVAASSMQQQLPYRFSSSSRAGPPGLGGQGLAPRPPPALQQQQLGGHGSVDAFGGQAQWLACMLQGHLQRRASTLPPGPEAGQQ